MRKNTNLEGKTHEHGRIYNCEWIVVEDRVRVGEQKYDKHRIHDESQRAPSIFGQKVIVSDELKQRPDVFVKTLVIAIVCIHCEPLIYCDVVSSCELMY